MLFFPIEWVPVPVPMGRKKKNPLDLDLHLNKLEFPSCNLQQEMFVPNLNEICQMFHFKRFFQIYTNAKIVSLLVSPTLTPGTIICTSLNLHYVRKRSCKYELFGLSGSQGKKNSMTTPNFCIFIYPLKRTWPFIWTTDNSLYPRMICTKFDWNWPAGSGEDFFPSI
jgi:hypothetical protein